ncbi:MAG: MBL fold metallo-hydrolase [Opitutales bacterium]|nr:MBL fold metallo-hydrolase [Opitutales bacterium]
MPLLLYKNSFSIILVLFSLVSTPAISFAQIIPFISGIEILDSGNAELQLSVPADQTVRIDTSTNQNDWHGLSTFVSEGNDSFTDLSLNQTTPRFYRATISDDLNILIGDHLATTSGDAIIHIIDHASFVISWNGLMIYNDPVGDASLYESLPRADLILVSHRHGDHFRATTLEAVKKEDTIIITSPEVFSRMSSTLQAVTTSLANDETSEQLGMNIEAIPAYNDRHPKGEGNSYVLTLGGKRLFMSGDTEDVPEMRALENIDLTFIAMNLPFTMSVTQVASAVREFQPKVVYPYHYRNQDGSFSDLNDFMSQVGSEFQIEVRLRDWY